jgi:tripartite-type tricarboxylate transporter receptor subunit TctC
MIDRRGFVAGALGALAASRASAQTSFPSRDVRLIVPYPVGGITDLLARKTAEMLSTAWSRPVVVDNKPGANGNIAAQIAATAPPDGHTLYMGFLGTHAANVSLYPKLGYDPVRDFAPISLLASAPMVLTVHPSVPSTSARAMVAYAKANPGALSFASSGLAAASHLALELFKSVAGVDIVHVPYRGTSTLITDLLSGRVHGYFDVPITSHQNVTAGKLVALMVGDERRNPRMPDVPTSAEAGYPDFLFTTWLGLLAPAGVQPSVLRTLHREVAGLSQKPEFTRWCEDRGLSARSSSTPEEFVQFLAAETRKFAAVIRDGRITLE